MTIDEKVKFNEKYKEYSEYTNDILLAAKKITEPYVRELNDIIDIMSSSCHIERKNGIIKTEFNISYSDMEVMAIKIPALCMNIQNKLNEISVKNSIVSLFVDSCVAENLELLKNEKGDARERAKKAEATLLPDRVVENVDKQVIQNLKDVIIRADKLYEGIKKVLDGRMRENEYNRKSQKFV